MQVVFATTAARRPRASRGADEDWRLQSWTGKGSGHLQSEYDDYGRPPWGGWQSGYMWYSVHRWPLQRHDVSPCTIQSVIREEDYYTSTGTGSRLVCSTISSLFCYLILFFNLARATRLHMYMRFLRTSILRPLLLIKPWVYFTFFVSVHYLLTYLFHGAESFLRS